MKKYLLPSALILIGFLGFAVAQNINKALQMSQSPGAFGVDSSNNVYFPAHVLSNGKAPSVNVGTLATGSTDFQGTVTESSNSLGGVLTFQTAFLAAPNCVLVGQAPGVALATPIAYSTATTNLTWTHLSQASQKISYICSGAK